MLERFTIGVPTGGIADPSSEVPLLDCIANQVLGYFGNSAIMPFFLPATLAGEMKFTSRDVQDALLKFHRQAFAPPRSSITLPARGVLGEAVLGSPRVEREDRPDPVLELAGLAGRHGYRPEPADGPGDDTEPARRQRRGAGAEHAFQWHLDGDDQLRSRRAHPGRPGGGPHQEPARQQPAELPDGAHAAGGPDEGPDRDHGGQPQQDDRPGDRPRQDGHDESPAGDRREAGRIDCREGHGLRRHWHRRHWHRLRAGGAPASGGTRHRLRAAPAPAPAWVARAEARAARAQAPAARAPAPAAPELAPEARAQARGWHWHRRHGYRRHGYRRHGHRLGWQRAPEAWAGAPAPENGTGASTRAAPPTAARAFDARSPPTVRASSSDITPTHRPTRPSSTAEDRAIDALTRIIDSANSPDMLEAQQIILRRLALSGDLFPSRIPAPANITQVGGYLNLIADDAVLRAQVLASALGVAGPNPSPGWEPTLPPIYLAVRANDRPAGASQPAIPVTFSIRSDSRSPSMPPSRPSTARGPRFRFLDRPIVATGDARGDAPGGPPASWVAPWTSSQPSPLSTPQRIPLRSVRPGRPAPGRRPPARHGGAERGCVAAADW